MQGSLKGASVEEVDLSIFKNAFYLVGYGERQLMHDKYLSYLNLRGFDVASILLHPDGIDINIGSSMTPFLFKGRHYGSFVCVDYKGRVSEFSGMNESDAMHISDCIVPQLNGLVQHLQYSKKKTEPTSAPMAGFQPKTVVSIKELFAYYLTQEQEVIRVMVLGKGRSAIYGVYWSDSYKALMAQEVWKKGFHGNMWRVDGFFDEDMFVVVGDNYVSDDFTCMSIDDVKRYMKDFGLNSARFLIKKINRVVEIFTEGADGRHMVAVVEGNFWGSEPVTLESLFSQDVEFMLTGYESSSEGAESEDDESDQ